MKDRWPDVEIELIPSRGGRFEVLLDGVPVFEKSRTRRHPHPGEIVQLVEADLA